MARISVVIPAYNCCGTIRKTINSIFSSGISNFEIVIVDDGSEDGTDRICDTLAQEYGCIRCIHQENAGVSAARNRGAREAAGEYIWFFDADDEAEERSAMRAEEILAEYTPDMLVFGVEFDYYHSGKVFRRDVMLPPMEGMVRDEECQSNLYDLFVSNSLSSLCNRMVKRSILTRLPLLLREEMFLYEDLEFTLRVLKRCSSVYYLKEAIYLYQQSEDGRKAGRRLMRAQHIPELLMPIEDALAGETDRKRILLALYETLAREKISVSSKTDIKNVCSDFRFWIDENGLLSEIEQSEYSMLIYHGQVSKLIIKRNYSKIRHSTANWVKQTIGDFRKW